MKFILVNSEGLYLMYAAQCGILTMNVAVHCDVSMIHCLANMRGQ